MKVIATSDVDRSLLGAVRSELAPDLELDLYDHAIFLRSVEPPSWIQFFADAEWWVKALGAYAALYVAELVKEAGKESWKERAKLARGASAAGNRILKFAQSLVKLRSNLPKRSKLVLGLPVPDEYFGVRFELVGNDEDLLAAEISIFVRYLPAIEKLIETEGLKSGKVVGAINLLIAEDLSLRVTWMDRQALKVEERILNVSNET